MPAISTYRVEASRTFKKPPARVVLAGGSGQMGTLLARHFHRKGCEVRVLARTTYSAPWRVMAWDGEHAGEWARGLDGANVLVNLAGRSVNCRYHRWNRREVLESRVRSTHALGEAIRSLSHPPEVWLNASTATIYRHSLDRAMDEELGEVGGKEKNVPEKWRFSIDVAKQWEEALFSVDTPATRKIALRSAMTMSADRGGVFDELSRLARFGLGGKAGSGEQFVSWIHETDFVRAIEFLIENEDMCGAVNVASPVPLRNAEFIRILRETWGIKRGIPASGWMLEVGAFVLRTESELILKSRRVVPGRLLQNGFRFEFPEWDGAAKDLVKRMRSQG